MGRFLGAVCLILLGVYFLRGGSFGGLLELVLHLLDALAGFGREMGKTYGPGLVHKP